MMGFQNGPFCSVIRPITQPETGRFSEENGLFCNTLYASLLQTRIRWCEMLPLYDDVAWHDAHGWADLICGMTHDMHGADGLSADGALSVLKSGWRVSKSGVLLLFHIILINFAVQNNK